MQRLKLFVRRRRQKRQGRILQCHEEDQSHVDNSDPFESKSVSETLASAVAYMRRANIQPKRLAKLEINGLKWY